MEPQNCPYAENCTCAAQCPKFKSKEINTLNLEQRDKIYFTLAIERLKCDFTHNRQISQEMVKTIFEFHKTLIRYLLLANGSACIALVYNASKFENFDIELAISDFVCGALYAILSMVFSYLFLMGASLYYIEINNKSDNISYMKTAYSIYNKVYNKKDNDSILEKPLSKTKYGYFLKIFVFLSIFTLCMSFFRLYDGAIKTSAIFGVDLRNIFF